MGSIAHPVFSLKIHRTPPPREIFSLCLWHTFIAAVEGWAKKEQQQQTHGAEEALIPITLCWSFVRTLPPHILSSCFVLASANCWINEWLPKATSAVVVPPTITESYGLQSHSKRASRRLCSLVPLPPRNKCLNWICTRSSRKSYSAIYYYLCLE